MIIILNDDEVLLDSNGEFIKIKDIDYIKGLSLL